MNHISWELSPIGNFLRTQIAKMSCQDTKRNNRTEDDDDDELEAWRLPDLENSNPRDNAKKGRRKKLSTGRVKELKNLAFDFSFTSQDFKEMDMTKVGRFNRS